MWHSVLLILYCELGTGPGSVANPGCLSRILDPNFSIPDPGSRFRIRDLDPQQSIEVFLTQKIVYNLSEI
jgi:hypothetical protein